MTESGTKHRASLHLVSGQAQLAQFERGGVDVFDSTAQAFGAALRRQNRRLKRALTDPAITLTGALGDSEVLRLHAAAIEVLADWIGRLRAEAGPGLPEKVTSSRPEMAVHGKYGKPCPVCGSPVQRVVYAENEANYCPGCQTGGKVFADRSLSRLLKDDWPRTLEDLERLKPATT